MHQHYSDEEQDSDEQVLGQDVGVKRYNQDVRVFIKYFNSSDYTEFARRDIGDVTITHISTPCNKCISISARMQKMHINDVTLKK
jgi:hypothetical protein